MLAASAAINPSHWSALSPEEALQRAIAHRDLAPQRMILTGERGAGKSTWCARLAQEARAVSWRVAGLWSPAVMEREAKIAIELVDLESGEKRRLAVRGTAEEGGTHGLRWRFVDETIAWGNALLGALASPDLLIVDELGPLEFRHEQGLQAGLAAVDRGAHRLAVVVIRPELLPDALARWPGAHVVTPPDWKAMGSAQGGGTTG